MKRNIALNSLQSNIVATELDWCVSSGGIPPRLVPFASIFHAPRSKPLPEHIPRPDIILAADCVYFEPAFPLLVSTLAALVPPLLESAPPEVLFCYKKRRKADKRFFAMLKKEFTWSVVCYPPS